MAKRIVVTGAGGYIGAHVTAELSRHKDVFSVVATDMSGHCPLVDDCKFIPLNLLNGADDEDLYERLGRPDACLHLAWRDGFQHNAMSHINDLPRHFAFIRNLADHGTSQFAIAGSFREYGKVSGRVDHYKPVVQDNLYSLAKSTLKTALEIYFQNKDICMQWLRPFTVYGDDEKNNSIMSKILRWENEGKTTFPFTDGNEEYDYIHVDVLSKQIAAVLSQTEVSGIIDCCSGKPTRIGDKIEQFLMENHLRIKPEYGAFPSRAYDSNVIYGDRTAIETILKSCSLFKGEDL